MSSTIGPHNLPGPRQAADSSDSRRRVRTRHACESCRRRRRKCDGKLPCGQCERHSYPCDYAGPSLDQDQDHRRAKQKQARVDDADEALSSSTQSKLGSPSFANAFQNASQSGRGLRTNPGQPQKARHAVDTEKGRYSNAYSGVVFPFAIARIMDLSGPLRFQSYGWNLSIRPEISIPTLPDIRNSLSYQEFARYTRIYFDVVDPCFHFLERDAFLACAAQYWTTESEAVDDMESVFAGTLALGSFFSKDPSPNEVRMNEHAKTILNAAVAYAPAWSSLNLTAGWILRTLYLRLTTRPALAWYSSCSSLHVAEANALHLDLSKAEIFNSTSSNSQHISSRTDLFGCALLLNSLISAEYGRSRVVLQNCTASLTASSAMMKLHSTIVECEQPLPSDRRAQILTSLVPSRNDLDVLALLQTDVAIHLYRHQWHLDSEDIRSQERTLLLTIIQRSFDNVKALLRLERSWWNVLSTPFQSLMVLLTVDTHDSLMLVEEAMAVLRSVHETFPTHLASEVMQISSTLIRAMKQRKSGQVNLLDRAISGEQMQAAIPEQSGEHDALDIDDMNGLYPQPQAMLDDWLALDIASAWPHSGDVFQNAANMAQF